MRVFIISYHYVTSCYKVLSNYNMKKDHNKGAIEDKIMNTEMPNIRCWFIRQHPICRQSLVSYYRQQSYVAG